MKKYTLFRKSVLLICAIVWQFSTLSALNYYWVGGSGLWSDHNNHWATTSGGAVFHDQVSQSMDNVLFDANSFPAGGTVTIDPTIIYCLNMDWTGATGSVSVLNENIPQPCLSEGITFSTQAQIDAFSVNYPGCTQIVGGVTINDGWSGNINNINGLSQITSIIGFLQIENCPNLTSLSGLNALTSVEGDIGFYYTGITSLTGLSALTFIGGDLLIYSNAAIMSLTGLNALTSIGGNLGIYYTAITSLSGLNELTSIGGDLRIDSNTDITSITGLNALTSIGGDLSIYSNTALTTLMGLNALTSIEGNLSIYINTALTSLTGLNALNSIGGALGIYYTGITSLTSLNALNSIGGALYLQDNTALSTCEVQAICDYLAVSPNNASIFRNATGCSSVGQVQIACGMPVTCPGNITFTTQAEIDAFPSVYSGCTAITGNVTIQGSDITSLNGLSQITSIGGELSIYSNAALTSLTGLNALTSIGGELSIYSNATLTSLTGLNALTSTGSLRISSNATLTSLTGLNALTSTGSLRISSNNTLTSLTGLNALTSIEGYFDIDENVSLTSLTGLNALSSIGSLRIQSNSSLTSLSGLNALTSIQFGSVEIWSNNSLTSLSGLSTVTSNISFIDISGNNALESLAGLEFITSMGGGIGVLQIRGNKALTSLTGLNALTSIEGMGGLTIYGNNALTSLTGLNALTSIGGNLRINTNNALTSLTGLNALTSVGGGLIEITNNSALTSLTGLGNINPLTITNLIIQSSNMLSFCSVPSICNYLAIPSNPATISGNAGGCASRTQVIGSCGYGCPAPSGLTVFNIWQTTATLSWNSNSTPTDNCWTVTLGGQGMALEASGCPQGGQELFITTVCYINNVPSFNAPVMGMTVVGQQITINVAGLPPGNYLKFYVSETCDGIAPPNNWSGCVGSATFLTQYQPCPTPSGLTAAYTGQTTATLRWNSNNTPTDNCWVVTVGSVGMIIGPPFGCPEGDQALFQTTICYINNVASFSTPVTGMTVVGQQITINVGGLPPGANLEFYVSETCDGITLPYNMSACVGQVIEAQPPGLYVSGNLNFGTVQHGSFDDMPVFLHNNTASIITVSNISFSPTGVFNVLMQNGNTILPGQSLPVSIFFFPPSVGTFNTTFTISSDAPNGDVTFTATGVGGNNPVSWVGVYNQPENNPEITTREPLEEHYITANTVNPIKICADGSKATIVKFINNNGSINTSNIIFNMKSDPYGDNTDYTGWFVSSDYTYNGNIVEAKFTHPKYLNISGLYRNDIIQVRNAVNGSIIHEFPARIYRAPVVLVHGLWGDMTSMLTVFGALLNSGKYNSPLLRVTDYSSSNSYSFLANSNVIKNDINSTLLGLRILNYSAGKVDIVAHSMGGVLSRIYLQKNDCGGGLLTNCYRGDIHKLITLNTPHSGTQIANFVFSDAWGAGLARDILDYNGMYWNSGAVYDLQCNSPAIGLLNGASLNNHIVPCFAIQTDRVPAANYQLSDEESLATLIARARLQTVGEFIDEVFAYTPTDLIVPTNSQRGGLNDFDFIQGTMHTASPDDVSVINTVKILLDENPATSVYFDQNGGGFNPPQIEPTFLIAEPELRQEKVLNTGIVTITNPTLGFTCSEGDVVQIDVTGPANINHLIVTISNINAGVTSFEALTNTATLNYTVPNNIAGPIKIMAIGFDETGFVDLDTLEIIANPLTTLDSLGFVNDYINIPVGQSAPFTLYGYFNDLTVRNLSQNGDIPYDIANPNIALLNANNSLTGLSAGTTFLHAFYQGKNAYIIINVYNGDDWLECINDLTPPVYYVTDVLGNILADNDPSTSVGTNHNLGNIATPVDACVRQDEYYVYGFDDCDGFITALNAVNAAAVTTPSTTIPGTQVSVTPDGFGFYLVNVLWSVGASTVTITGRDAADNPTDLTLSMTIQDNTLPVATCSGQTITFNGQPNISLNIGDLVTATDNCDIQNIVLSPATITCAQVGTIVPLTATVTDLHGNTADCISQITVTGLPCGWSQQPNGINCNNGSSVNYNPSSQVFTLTSTNCYSTDPFTADAMAYTQRSLCGDGSITAQITNITNPGAGWAGIVMRESNATGAKKVQLMTNLGSLHRREVRYSTGGASYPQQTASNQRHWLRIVRQGNQFTAYTSPNGIQWYQVMTATVDMSACIEMGLAVTNNQPTGTVTATFTNVSTTGNSSGLLPPGINEQLYDPPLTLDFSLFPNPTTGEINIDLSAYSGRPVRIELYTPQGQQLRFVEIQEVQAAIERLDLSAFANGMYWIKVKTPGLPDTTKRVVLTGHSDK